MAKKPPADPESSEPSVAPPSRTPAPASPSSYSTSPSPPSAPSAPKSYRASFYPDKNVPSDFAEEMLKLESELGMPVYLLIQNDGSPSHGFLTGTVYRCFFDNRAEIEPNKKVALVIDSPGGFAPIAFKLAKFLRHHCGGFVAIVPSYAKSAATLLTLGAERILLGAHAELGPLDIQEEDPERPETGTSKSVLNSVQTLERLNAFALRSLDETMQLLLRRTKMTVSAILPRAIDLVGHLLQPLMNNIDVIAYTEKSRILRVAEQYAIRLLRPKYSKEQAEKIATNLVELYPEHGFVIDRDEIIEVGLKAEYPKGTVFAILDRVRPHFDRITAIGRIKEVPS